MFVPNLYGDQAESLRRLNMPRPVRVLAIASGKGGVGKTNVSVNLSIALAAEGKSVLLMDADLGLANVDVLLGLHPTYTLAHVIAGECRLEEAIMQGPAGLGIVPAASGIRKMVDLRPAEYAGLIRAFSDLSRSLDVLVIDTAAGISAGVTNFCRAAQEVIVVVCDEPASITDAYALIKLLHREYGVRRFRVLANMAATPQSGRDVYQKLLKVTTRFLEVALDYMGHVPFDEYLRKAVQRQKPVVEAYPRSRAAIAFKNLAQRADKWPVASVAGGHLEFFVERLVQQGYHDTVLPL